MKKFIYAVCLALAFSSCTKRAPVVQKSPEEVVKEFVELSASAKEIPDKKKLQELCIGDLRRTFERMTDEAFRVIYLDSKLKILDLKIVENQTQGENAAIVYRVTVDNRQGTDITQEINQREVVLKSTKEGWFIETVRMKGTDQIAFTRGMIF